MKKRGFVFILCVSFAVIFIYTQNRNLESALLVPPAFDYFGWKQSELSRQEEREHIFKKNESLYQVLVERYHLPSYLAYELGQKIEKVIPVNKIKPGYKLRLIFSQNILTQCIISPSMQTKYIFTITPYGITYAVSKTPSHVFLTVAEGKIKTNLYNSALDHHIEPQLILTLADIFAWDIDFFTDLRPGDKYQFVYEKIFAGGKFIRNGRILAAKFVNQGRVFEAYYFETSEGKGGYYDARGNSLRKAFLKAPLRFKRISSYFSYHRRHPILGIVRPHLGIDYAAPIGTPVEAIADGRIVFIGWNDGFGKFIKIRHNHIYTSTYGHLSRFARGLRRGSHVKQGQVIGYVGKTGLATGPHLDFRFLKNGRFINYLRFKSPVGKPLPKKYRTCFKEQVARLKAILEQPNRYARLYLGDVIDNRLN
ncbi:MAG: M23 family metallopeptidase [Candidatus Desulfofervidaceae bacterium]|nr:M23 family metallopeptidase [Candidatus Desulfofervidaceae bacterium]